MNLLQETIEVMTENEKTWDDVIFIGTLGDSPTQATVDEFMLLANVDYDNGFGSAEIKIGLTIVFKCGGTMTRDEYDGSENWYFTPVFEMPLNADKLTTVSYNYWS